MITGHLGDSVQLLLLGDRGCGIQGKAYALAGQSGEVMCKASSFHRLMGVCSPRVGSGHWDSCPFQSPRHLSVCPVRPSILPSFHDPSDILRAYYELDTIGGPVLILMSCTVLWQTQQSSTALTEEPVMTSLESRPKLSNRPLVDEWNVLYLCCPVW